MTAPENNPLPRQTAVVESSPGETLPPAAAKEPATDPKEEVPDSEAAPQAWRRRFPRVAAD